MSSEVHIPEEWRREVPAAATRIGWILLLVGAAAVGGAYLLDAKRAAFNTVILFLLMTSIAGGALFLLALEYIAGAVWSVPIRRVVEFLAGLTPVLPVLALPLLLNLHDLFHWTHADAVAGDPLLKGKEPYLNVPFFLSRFAAVFALWILFTWLFVRHSRLQDRTGDQRLTRRNVRLAAAFLPVFAVTITILAIDWMMSLEPHWFSTIFGVYYFSGTVLAGVAAVTYATVRLHEAGLLAPLRRDHFYSLGALLFAFINFWAYIAFSQFLLIWYANIPEETFWFMARWRNGWEYVSILLIVVHFAVPYFALLTQDSKMDLRRLKLMAIWILAAHALDLYWLIMPTYSPDVTVGWMEILFPFVAVGLTVVLFGWQAKRANLVPVKDPKLQRALDFRL
jgi:hypothetical protein